MRWTSGARSDGREMHERDRERGDEGWRGAARWGERGSDGLFHEGREWEERTGARAFEGGGSHGYGWIGGPHEGPYAHGYEGPGYGGQLGDLAPRGPEVYGACSQGGCAEGYPGWRSSGEGGGVHGSQPQPWGSGAEWTSGGASGAGHPEFGTHHGGDGAWQGQGCCPTHAGSAWAGASEQERPGVRGRLPKNYRRSDERIREEICEALMQQPGVDVSDVEVSVAGGEVTLSGTVPERRIKHHVEDLCENRLGVTGVTNKLKVRKDAHRESDWDPAQAEAGQRGARGTPAEGGQARTSSRS